MSAAPKPNNDGTAPLRELLEKARKALIDTGTRNRLIHTNRTGKRPSTLAIVSDDADRLFRRLVRDHVSLPFRSEPRFNKDAEDSSGTGKTDLTTVRQPQKSSGSGEPVLQTRVAEETLQKRLLKFLRDGKTLEDEQGVNILFLAFGFLRWYEDENSSVLREAPLILVPVSLSRDAKQMTFRLRVRDEDIVVNQPLAERLRNDGVALPDLPSGDEWLPAQYFEAVQFAVGAKRRWSVDSDGIELGFFSFAKFLMFRDLSGSAWPGEQILHHPLLNDVLLGRPAPEEPLFPEDERKIDDILSPEDLIHVVDADGSQALAIEAVRAGRSLVIQGPPGTGKSQTIANILAAAAYDGKSVLFVAEKLVALKVVHDTLKKVGLGDICLELHSRASNKRQLVDELGKTLASAARTGQSSASSERLKQVRDDLNAIDRAMHKRIGQTGASAYSALGSLVRATQKALPPPNIAFKELAEWDEATFARVATLTEKLGHSLENMGGCEAHPWRGVGNIAIQPPDLDRIKKQTALILRAIADLAEKIEQSRAAAILPPPLKLKDIRGFAELLLHFQNFPSEKPAIVRHLLDMPPAERKRVLEVAREGHEIAKTLVGAAGEFAEKAFDGDLTSLRNVLVRGTSSWFARRGRVYRQACGDIAHRLCNPSALPKSPQARVALVDRLIDLKIHREAICVHMVRASNLFGQFWSFERTDFSGFIAACDWLHRAEACASARTIAAALDSGLSKAESKKLGDEILSCLNAIEPESRSLLKLLECDPNDLRGANDTGDLVLADFALRVADWNEATGRYGEWVTFLHHRAALAQVGATAVADAVLDGRLTPNLAREELLYARAEMLWRLAIKDCPRLNQQLGDERTSLVKDFRKLESQRRQDAVALIRARHAESIPKNGQMMIIRGEMAKMRNHMAIRKLMSTAGSVLQKIKPLFLMSPISVAQYLKPGAIDFDILVIDEASQVRPEDALGVCARAKQIVVVGDRHQLPPTNFFSRLLDDDGDDEEDEDKEDSPPTPVAPPVTEAESILTLCEAGHFPSRPLRWHYRSRHPSLIQVSNAEFYKSQLLFPPSPCPVSDSLGLKLHKVGGAYDRGGARTNAVEGQAVVDAMAAHAREQPEESLGVVTFSVAQRDLILALMDERRRVDPEFDQFLTTSGDDVFVKNLENVQGDQRDVILISIGYGPRQPGGRLDSMHFGPVSTDGGERRLNVLFTRARTRCQIFASFDSGDIDRTRARSEGARVLQRFLAFAESGQIDQPDDAGGNYDSPFEEDVAAAIHALGYQSVSQVGSAGFRIDLGVRHPDKPGRFILAVECDGAAYHSAAWARERDRHRQEILEEMGWRFHRIWGTDWFYRRNAEIVKLAAALEAARNELK